MADYEHALAAAVAAAAACQPLSSAERLAEAQRLSRLPSGADLRVRVEVALQLTGLAFDARFDSPKRSLALSALAWQRVQTATGPRPVVIDAQAEAAAVLGNAKRIAGDLRGALRCLKEARRLAELGSGDLLLASRIEELTAVLLVGLGYHASAARRLRRCYYAYLDLQETHLAGRAAVSLGKAYSREGRLCLALSATVTGLKLLDRGKEPATMLAGLQNLVLFLGESGEPDRAIALLGQVRGLWHRYGSETSRRRLDWVHARLLATAGRPREAAIRLATVREAFRAAGNEYEAALAGLEVAALLWGLSQPEEAIALVEDAHLLLAAIGAGQASIASDLLAALSAGLSEREGRARIWAAVRRIERRRRPCSGPRTLAAPA